MPVSPRCASQSEIHLLANSVPRSSSGMKFAANIDTYPLFGGADAKDSFLKTVAETAGVQEADILGHDLFLYVRGCGTVLGAKKRRPQPPR